MTINGHGSTLSLPILDDDQVVAGVNLYASTDDAFDGKHVEVARVCRAWAPGAVTNADLAFRTREEAADVRFDRRCFQRACAQIGPLFVERVQAAFRCVLTKGPDKTHQYRVRLPKQFAEEVDVLGENRTRPIKKGWLEDEFGPFAVHTYGPLRPSYIFDLEK